MFLKCSRSVHLILIELMYLDRVCKLSHCGVHINELILLSNNYDVEILKTFILLLKCFCFTCYKSIGSKSRPRLYVQMFSLKPLFE